MQMSDFHSREYWTQVSSITASQLVDHPLLPRAPGNSYNAELHM